MHVAANTNMMKLVSEDRLRKFYGLLIAKSMTRLDAYNRNSRTPEQCACMSGNLAFAREAVASGEGKIVQLAKVV